MKLRSKVALLIFPLISIVVALSPATPAAASPVNNDHVWNNYGTWSLCAGCSSIEYVAAWVNTYIAPTTLSVTPYNTSAFEIGTSQTYAYAYGWDSAGSGDSNALNYGGYWWAATDVTDFSNNATNPALQLTFANGS
jgi:hypothetical protein